MGLRNFEYLIEVAFVHASTSVWHRYSGFKRLYDMLRDKHGDEHISMFPKQKINKWSQSVTEERVKLLGEFLQAICSNEQLRTDSTFKEFLSLDDTSRHQFYENNQNVPRSEEEEESDNNSGTDTD